MQKFSKKLSKFLQNFLLKSSSNIQFLPNYFFFVSKFIANSLFCQKKPKRMPTKLLPHFYNKNDKARFYQNFVRKMSILRNRGEKREAKNKKERKKFHRESCSKLNQKQDKTFAKKML